MAYLKNFGIVISQDNFIENIHFKREWYTPYQLGYKATVVNISDILASGAKPEYISIGLSLPNNIDKNFISDFYEGVKNGLYGAKVTGGDITGSSNEIFISVTVLGSTNNRNISSRKYAIPGYSVITKGNHGSSSAGLSELKNKGSNNELISAHIKPILEYEFSEYISTRTHNKYAMMDTSDGLADALFKIAEASNVKIVADYNRIPHLPCILKENVLFGGEDYKLIAAVPSELVSQIPDAVIIGKVCEYDGIRLEISGDCYNNFEELNLFNHFN